MPKIFDLSEYSSQPKDPSPAKNAKYSALLGDQVRKNETIQTTEHSTTDEKEHRVNMAFSDKNYDFILSETSKLGINFMHFLNQLIRSTSKEDIEDFLNLQPFRKGGRSSAPRRRGHKMKRINFKIFHDNHKKLITCALHNDATITTIVNVILEIYMAKNNHNFQ